MRYFLYGFLVLCLAAACNTTKQPTVADPQVMDEGIDFRPSAWRANPPEPGPAPEIKLGDFQDFKLDNGLQVILVENHKLPRVSYQLFVDVPPHLEGDYSGTSGLLGSMLRRATSEMTKEEIDEAVDFIGANLSTSGSGAFASTISKYKEQMMEMMGKVVLDARFPEEEFAKVKDDALANLKTSLANPDAIARRVTNVLTYGTNHPYGELQTEETLENITLDVVKRYYDNYFVPNRSYLVMVGDLTRAEAESMAKKTFGGWAEKDVTVPDLPQPERPEGVVVNFVPRSGSVQSVINVSHPVVLKPGTKEAIRASLVNNILGVGFSGRLFQNLREDKAYTYGAYSSLNPSRVIGSFNASTSVRNEVTDSAVAELMLEIAKISSEPVSQEELQRTKALISGSFGRALESPQRLAGYALSTIRYGLDRNFYPNYLQKVQASSANDLLEVAREAMSPKGTHIIVVGDKSVADKLARFATNGKINYFDVNGQPLDMEAMAAPSDVTAESVLKKYVQAIGGMEAIGKIKNISLAMEADVQGMKIKQTMIKDGGNKFSSQTTGMGMVLADQRYNDGKAMMKQQGQAAPVTDELTAQLKESAALFPLVNLLNELDRVTVSGTETIDGRKAVVLDVTGPTGTAQHYFDQESGLRVRTIQKQGPATVTIDYSDFREVGGVLMPGTTTLSGMMPVPLVMKTQSAETNTEIDQSLFSVE